MEQKRGDGVALGVFLGLLNAFVIAIGISGFVGVVTRHGDRFRALVIVFILGAVPAVLAGAALGWYADSTARAPVWLRRILLVTPAVLLVAALGIVFDLHAVIAVSCIPTTAAAFWLERSTRHRDALPVVAVR